MDFFKKHVKEQAYATPALKKFTLRLTFEFCSEPLNDDTPMAPWQSTLTVSYKA